jgi:hypothetical protein
MTDLEMKLKVIEDHKAEKLVVAIACQSKMPHLTIAAIFKSKKEVMETMKRSASLKATRLQKLKKSPY